MGPEKVFKTTALILLYTRTHMRCRIYSFINTQNIQSFKQHSSTFLIHPSTFIALMSIKQAYDALRIISSSLHLSLHMPAFKLGTCRWLLRITSPLTTASEVSVNTETSFSQTLHQHREEGTPNMKSFQLKWRADAKVWETEFVQCLAGDIRKQAMNLLTIPMDFQQIKRFCRT